MKWAGVWAEGKDHRRITETEVTIRFQLLIYIIWEDFKRFFFPEYEILDFEKKDDMIDMFYKDIPGCSVWNRQKKKKGRSWNTCNNLGKR